MKSRMELWTCALYELGARCSVSTPELERDIKTALKRFEHEGDAFFTITLPAFGKDFERSLSEGRVHDGLFRGWSRRKSSEELNLLHDPNLDTSRNGNRTTPPPRFLGGFLDRVLDGNGLLFDMYPGFYDPSDTEAIYAIRQLTLMFGKLKEPCSPERIADAYTAYVKVDQEIHQHLDNLFHSYSNVEADLIDPLRQCVGAVFGRALYTIDREIEAYEVIPKHGPGKTADRKLGNQKYYQTEWPVRMEQLFPFMEYAVPSRNPDLLQGVTFLEPEDERPVRVTDVPKTAKTPRIIAIEPTCMQYMQQAVGSRLQDLLERPFIDRASNPGHFLVGFEAQEPNQFMAQIGSEDGSLATLDLSEASDRVPNWLVETLFENFPHFSEAVQVTRSLRADVPGHGVIPLSKFASMGSAMTFPIEAMIFAAVAVKTVVHGKVADSRPVTYKDIRSLRDTVRVYGDDIIVPTDSAVRVVDQLETFGFKVNRNKSFWTGKFRESCGKEFYNGDDVSIVRFRRDLPTRLPRRGEDATNVASTVETRNQLYLAGLWKTAGLLDEVLERILKGAYPYVGQESPILGRVSHTYGFDTHGVSGDLQSPLVRGFVLRSDLPENEARDEAALLKCLLINGDANTDDEHLTKSGRPRVVSIKRGMARPY